MPSWSKLFYVEQSKNHKPVPSKPRIRDLQKHTSHISLLASFAFACLLRSIPELIASPNPIGYDTIAYALQIQQFENWISCWPRLFLAPLLYFILAPFAKLWNIFNVLALASCILYGLLSASIFYFTKHQLKWSTRHSILASIILTLQFTALRISWDLLRNELGLILLLLTFPWLEKTDSRKGIIISSILSTLVVLAHQIASSALVFIVLATALLTVIRGKRGRAFSLLLSIIPAATLLFISLSIFYGIMPEPICNPSMKLGLNVLDASQKTIGYGIFLDYTKVYNWSYLEIFSEVLSLFQFYYLPILPLALIGLHREKLTALWTIFLLATSFNILITPNYALAVWQRWMLTLSIPFSIYATRGVIRLLQIAKLKVLKAAVLLIILLLFASLSYGFMANPPEKPHPYFDLYHKRETLLQYFPSSMQMNTVPLQDTEDTVEILDELNEVMSENSCLLVHNAFYNWAMMRLQGNKTLVYYGVGFKAPLLQGLKLAEEKGFKTIYWIWWKPGLDWYGQEVPPEFQPYLQSGRITAYIYAPSK